MFLAPELENELRHEVLISPALIGAGISAGGSILGGLLGGGKKGASKPVPAPLTTFTGPGGFLESQLQPKTDAVRRIMGQMFPGSANQQGMFQPTISNPFRDAVSGGARPAAPPTFQPRSLTNNPSFDPLGVLDPQTRALIDDVLSKVKGGGLHPDQARPELENLVAGAGPTRAQGDVNDLNSMLFQLLTDPNRRQQLSLGGGASGGSSGGAF